MGLLGASLSLSLGDAYQGPGIVRLRQKAREKVLFDELEHGERRLLVEQLAVVRAPALQGHGDSHIARITAPARAPPSRRILPVRRVPYGPPFRPEQVSGTSSTLPHGRGYRDGRASAGAVGLDGPDMDETGSVGSDRITFAHFETYRF